MEMEAFMWKDTISRIAPTVRDKRLLLNRR